MTNDKIIATGFLIIVCMPIVLVGWLLEHIAVKIMEKADGILDRG